MLQAAAQRLLYVVGFGFFALVFYLFNSLRHRGVRHMPRKGAVLLVANHQSFWDPVILGLVTVRPLRYIARKSLYANKFLAHLMSALGAHPIDQDGSATAGIKAAIQLLKDGNAVLFFPEGNRTEDGALQEFKPGISLVLKRAPVMVLPVGLAGAYEAWPRWRKLPRFAPLFLPAAPGTIGVVFGEPIPSAKLLSMGQEEMLYFLRMEVMKLKEQAENLRRKV